MRKYGTANQVGVCVGGTAGGSYLRNHVPTCKGGVGGYWGNGLVEVECKVYMVVLNLILKKGMDLHNSLHGFQEEYGTRMATIESMLSHQLAGLDHESLLQVFLDLQKTYDLFYRGEFQHILRG